MSTEAILIVSAIISGVLTAAGTLYSTVRSARKDELNRLVQRVAKLTRENELWRKNYSILYDYVLKLRTILA